MKYIAELQYSDYDDYGYMHLTFDGSEEELASFIEKIKNVCEWYILESNKICIENSYEINYKKLKDIRKLQIDDIWIDAQYLFLDYSSTRGSVNYELPTFKTLDDFYNDIKENNKIK